MLPVAKRSLVFLGVELIEEDLRRLKKLSSLENDIREYFPLVRGSFESYGFCRDKNDFIFGVEGLLDCYKTRLRITDPFLSPSKGCRLFYIVTTGSHFVPILVYRASEESSYPISASRRIIKERIDRWLKTTGIN